jgi:hypothetical protein
MWDGGLPGIYVNQLIQEPPLSAPAFDPSELIDDFEHPICQLCLGGSWVRDENDI